MNSIATVQITPVKEVCIYDVIKEMTKNKKEIKEHFDPKNYTSGQIRELQKKGYEPSDDNTASGVASTATGATGTTGATNATGTTGATGATNATGTTGATGATGTTGATNATGTTGAAGATGTTGTTGSTKKSGSTLDSLGGLGGDSMMGPNGNKMKGGIANKTNSLMMGSGGTPQSMDQVKKNLQKGAISNDIQNKQFIQSTMKTSGPNLAMSKKLDEADKRFNALKEQVVQTNDMSIQKLRNDYESKIKNWTNDYKKSILAYKEYIANQAKHLSEVEQYSKSIEQQLKRNETERLTLSNKWNECQSKINRHEREILQYSSSDKQIIKELEAKLKKEKSKQGNLDAMMTRLREEKEKLDQAYENNMGKLKAGGLGNNCPKGFNMNDYILKKNIPCWGCIL